MCCPVFYILDDPKNMLTLHNRFFLIFCSDNFAMFWIQWVFESGVVIFCSLKFLFFLIKLLSISVAFLLISSSYSLWLPPLSWRPYFLSFYWGSKTFVQHSLLVTRINPFQKKMSVFFWGLRTSFLFPVLKLSSWAHVCLFLIIYYPQILTKLSRHYVCQQIISSLHISLLCTTHWKAIVIFSSDLGSTGAYSCKWSKVTLLDQYKNFL